MRTRSWPKTCARISLCGGCQSSQHHPKKHEALVPVRQTRRKRNRRLCRCRQHLRAESEEFVNRLQQHALGNTECSKGLKTPFANTVVNGATRDVEQVGGLLDRDAAAKSW